MVTYSVPVQVRYLIHVTGNLNTLCNFCRFQLLRELHIAQTQLRGCNGAEGKAYRPSFLRDRVAKGRASAHYFAIQPITSMYVIHAFSSE